MTFQECSSALSTVESPGLCQAAQGGEFEPSAGPQQPPHQMRASFLSRRCLFSANTKDQSLMEQSEVIELSSFFVTLLLVKILLFAQATNCSFLDDSSFTPFSFFTNSFVTAVLHMAAWKRKCTLIIRCYIWKSVGCLPT